MDKVYIWQFKHGNQGMNREVGVLESPIVKVQLLECFSLCVSGSPKVRVADCVEVCGTLREVRYNKNFCYDQPEPCVTLAAGEELPQGDNWTPTEGKWT